MIEVFFGPNGFELEQALKQRLAASTVDIERVDAQSLTKNTLLDLVSARSLFAQNRLLLIRDLALESELWDIVPSLPEHSDELTQVILWEHALDKRTKTYKWLQKNATLHEFEEWSSSDEAKASEWCRLVAKKLGFTLSSKNATYLVQRVGMNQWQLFHALQKLSLIDDVGEETIDAHVEPSRTENVFNVLAATITGDSTQLTALVEQLRQTEDPYRLFALLSSQVFQLTAAGLTQKSANQVASDLSVSPYVMTKLAPLARKLGPAKLRAMLALFATADTQLKSSSVDPWIILERTLLGTLDLPV